MRRFRCCGGGIATVRESPRVWKAFSLEHVTEKLTITEEKAGAFRRVAEVPMRRVWSCEVMFPRSRLKVSLTLIIARLVVLVEVELSGTKHARREKQLQE